MGEQADFLIDSMIDGWVGNPWPRRRRVAMSVTCRKCQKTGLRWRNVKGGGWRVHEKTGELHVCSYMDRKGLL